VATPKNGQVADFYERCGFTCVSEDTGRKSYVLDLEKADLSIESYYHIELK